MYKRQAFDKPITVIVDWIGDHRLILLVISFALVGLSIALEARKGETEIGSLTHLDDELEEELDEVEADAEAGEPEDRR